LIRRADAPPDAIAARRQRHLPATFQADAPPITLAPAMPCHMLNTLSFTHISMPLAPLIAIIAADVCRH